MAGDRPVAGSASMPVTDIINGAMAPGAVVTLPISSTTDAQLIIAANPDRHLGVLVQVAGAVNARIHNLPQFTSTEGILIASFGAANASDNVLFIYGNGALYGKSNSAAATTTVTYQEI